MTIYKLYWIHRIDSQNPLNEGYIGVTKDINERMKTHKKSNYIVGKALRKYDDIIVDIIKENLSESEAFVLELSYRPHENIGWNITAGGKGAVGSLIPSEETKQKMVKGRLEYYAKFGNSAKGKTWNWQEKSKQKLSKTLKEKYNKGYVNNRKGITLSDSQKEKQRIAALNRPRDHICQGCNTAFTKQGLMSHTRHKECNGYRFTPPGS